MSKDTKKPAAKKTKPAAKKTKPAAKEKAEPTSMAAAFSSLSKLYPSNEEQTIYPSGSVAFDLVLTGIGGQAGLPAGRVIELTSDAGLGKSTAALWFCKSLIRNGLSAVYIDFEHAINPSILEGVGLEPFLGQTFGLHTAHTFKDLEAILEAYIDIPDVGIIVVDSMPSIMPDRMEGTSIVDIQPGLHARLVTSLYLKYKAAIAKSGKVLIVVNHMRTKFEFGGRFQKTEVVAAGGFAQKYYPDIRIMMEKKRDTWTDRREKDHAPDAEIVGADLGIWTIKNKFTLPYKKAAASILFGKGISNSRFCAIYAETEGWISHSGSGWYSINIPGIAPEKVQGRLAIEEWMKSKYDDVLDAFRERGWL